MPSGWRFRRQYQRLQIGLIVCLTLYASFSPSSFLPIRWVVRELQVMEDQKQQDNNEVSSRPNILLFVLDQWRYDWDGMTNSNDENNNIPPNLDAETGISDTTTTTMMTTTTTSSHNPLSMPFLREAASRGVRFTQAYVPVPLCAPVRSCLAAGKEYDEAGVFTNHGDLWPVHQETFYKLLRDKAKYQVFTCGKDDLYKNDINFPFYNRHHLDRMMPAIDLGFTNAMRSAGKHKVTRENPKLQERYRTFLESTTIVTNRKQQQQHQSKKVKAFDVYKDCFEESETGVKGKLCTADLFTNDIYPDDFVANEAIELLNQRNPNEPWFLQVNFPGPHAPQVRKFENKF
jgi:arylsulfatase A-like enzyme